MYEWKYHTKGQEMKFEANVLDMGPMEWFSGQRHLLPSIRSWVPFSEQTWWKERINSHKLPSDLHTQVMAHRPRHTYKRVFCCCFLKFTTLKQLYKESTVDFLEEMNWWDTLESNRNSNVMWFYFPYLEILYWLGSIFLSIRSITWKPWIRFPNFFISHFTCFSMSPVTNATLV